MRRSYKPPSTASPVMVSTDSGTVTGTTENLRTSSVVYVDREGEKTEVFPVSR